jgi:hypothetical protein
MSFELRREAASEKAALDAEKREVARGRAELDHERRAAEAKIGLLQQVWGFGFRV